MGMQSEDRNPNHQRVQSNGYPPVRGIQPNHHPYVEMPVGLVYESEDGQERLLCRNPIVKPVEKPDRTATHVPPENEGKTVVSEKDKTLLSDGTPIVQSVENNASIHHKGPEPNGITEQNLTHSFPLLSLAEQERDNDQPPSGLTVTDGLSGQSNYLLPTDTGMDEGTKPSPTENDQPSSRQCPALLQECSTIGKEKSSENVP